MKIVSTKYFSILVMTILLLSLNNYSNQGNIEKCKLILTNPNKIKLSDEIVYVDLKFVLNKIKNINKNSISVWENEEEIPFQIEIDSERNINQLVLVLDFQPKEKKILEVKNIPSKKEFKKRTQAELSRKIDYVYMDGKYSKGRFQNVEYFRVPDEHKDHDALFRYEGPGWESDKIGYRFYLDQRNRNDIFGKKVNDLVLHEIGINDLEAKDDSYHTMQWWGMDIFKVGNSLGIGSIATFRDGKVIPLEKRDSVICIVKSNGILKSAIETRYFGWAIGDRKYNLVSNLSISAGSRVTRVELELNPKLENICTGLAKYENTKYFESSSSEGGWQYFAIYGKQSLAGDNLGIALIYRKDDLISLLEDELNHLVILKPVGNKLIYHFTAAWEQEPSGIKNIDQFKEYLDSVIFSLNNPVKIEIL